MIIKPVYTIGTILGGTDSAIIESTYYIFLSMQPLRRYKKTNHNNNLYYYVLYSSWVYALAHEIILEYSI